MANVKISQLTSLTAMTDAAVVPVVEGAATKKITGSALKTYMNDTKTISHTADVLVGGSSEGDGSSIAITDNYQTERVNITNSLGDVGRATLPNVSVSGKIVILTSTSSDATYVDRYRYPGGIYSYVSVSNTGNGKIILMSLGSNGWSQIQTND